MPVDLSQFEVHTDAPHPPRFWLWAFLFVVIVGAGIALTLLYWSANEPTNTAWFWCCVAVFPPLTWSLFFGLRLHFYDEQHEEYRVLHALRSEQREQATRFAREPLAVIAVGYLSGLGSFNAAWRFLNAEPPLAARVPNSNDEAVRHTSIILPADHETVALRYRSCFMELLGSCAHALQFVPDSAPLSVLLDVPSSDNLTRDQLLDIWRVCWDECDFRPAPASVCQEGKGLMPLDAWLDHRGGPELERYTLFASAQLHEQPLPDSAEAGVAMLLAWAPLAERQSIQVLAMLHRPLETLSADLRTGISDALNWGRAAADEVKDLWQTGLLGSDKSSLLNAATDLELAITSESGFPGIRDLDAVLGYAGRAAGLLSIALAVERAKESNGPQLIAWRDDALQFAVVQPLANENQDTEVGA